MRFLFVFLFAFPAIAFAQEPPQWLVPLCGGNGCNICDVVQLGENIVNWLLWFGGIVALLLIFYSGFLFVTSVGDPGGMAKAKKLLVSVFIGFGIALSAWLIVDLFFSLLTKGGLDYWQVGQCEFNPEYKDGTRQEVEVGGVCRDCEDISGLPQSPDACGGESCKVDSTFADKLYALYARTNEASIFWEVTDAWQSTPDAAHNKACYLNGTCVDAVFSGSTSITGDNIATFILRANAVGLYPIYVVPGKSACESLQGAPGVPQGAIDYDDTITGGYFIIYNSVPPRGTCN